MEIRPIKTETDYNKSIQRIEVLWGSVRDTPEGDELDVLCTLVKSLYKGLKIPAEILLA